MSQEESSSKNRIHYQWQPDILFYEDLKIDVLEKLEYDFVLRKRKLGEIQSILKTSDGYKGILIQDDQMENQLKFTNKKRLQQEN